MGVSWHGRFTDNFADTTVSVAQSIRELRLFLPIFLSGFLKANSIELLEGAAVVE
jgi:hypothetical protein